MKKIGRLCVITDTAIQKKYSHYEIAKMAIKGGAGMIQLRDKSLPTGELVYIAIQIRKLCRKSKVLFIVNDRVDVTMLSDADGVHLGLEDISIKDARKLLGKNKIIGGTAHSLKEAKEAEKNGADYIGFGHIFPTSSKLKTDKPKGVMLLRKVVEEIRTPMIAIGGINTVNIIDVMNTGVHGTAVIGSVVKSKEPVKTVKEMRKKIYG
jgi:thiamine-phosphate pyrophosphorylase